jgi:hypothetical protein
MNATVDDKHWVQACMDAGWAYLNHTGSDEIVVRSKDEPATDTGAYVEVCRVTCWINPKI